MTAGGVGADGRESGGREDGAASGRSDKHFARRRRSTPEGQCDCLWQCCPAENCSDWVTAEMLTCERSAGDVSWGSAHCSGECC